MRKLVQRKKLVLKKTVQKPFGLKAFSFEALIKIAEQKSIKWGNVPELYRKLRLPLRTIIRFETERLKQEKMRHKMPFNARENRNDAVLNMQFWGFNIKGLK